MWHRPRSGPYAGQARMTSTVNRTSDVRNILGFFVVPALSIVSSVLLLPMVTAKFGPSGLSALAIGSGIGALGGVGIGLLWPLVGGYMVGSAATEHRRGIYEDSITSRALASILVFPICGISALVVGRQDSISALLFALAVAANGFTASWYFAGIGAPMLLVRNEAVPRVSSYLIAGVVLHEGAPLWAYGVSMMGAAALSFYLNWRIALSERPTLDWRRGSRIAVSHLRGTCVRLLQFTFTYLRAPIYSGTTHVGLAGFSASEQLQGAAANAAAALPAGLTRYVTQPASSRRRKEALALCCAAAFVGLVLWLVLAPFALRVLFSGHISLSRAEEVAIGFAISFTFLARCVEQLVLVPTNRRSLVYENNILFSIVGVVCLLVGVTISGQAGGIYSVAVVAVLATGHYAFRAYTSGW